MIQLVVFVSLLLTVSTGEPVTEVQQDAGTTAPSGSNRSWFARAFDSIEDSFKDMVDKIEKGFVTSVEEKKTDGEGKDDGAFINRTQTIFEVNGQKFMRTRFVEQKKTNTSTSYTEREVVRPLTEDEIAKIATP